MKDDEAFYALAGIELVNNPNQGLLVKCTTQFPNDPNQAKAEYIRVRVEQMKEDLALELERKKREKKEREEKQRWQRYEEEEEIRDNEFKRYFSQEELAEYKKVLSSFDKRWRVSIRDNGCYGFLVFGICICCLLFSASIIGNYFPHAEEFEKLGICLGSTFLVWAFGYAIHRHYSSSYDEAIYYVEYSKRLGLDKSTEAPKQSTVEDD